MSLPRPLFFRASARNLWPLPRMSGGPSGAALTVIVLSTLLALAAPKFLSLDNFQVIAYSVANLAVVAFAQMVVLAAGGMDLSVGAVGGLTAVVVGGLMETVKVPPEPAMLAGLLLGLGAGALNGFLVVRSGLSAFIVTLATASVFTGLNLGLTSGRPFYYLPDRFKGDRQLDHRRRPCAPLRHGRYRHRALVRFQQARHRPPDPRHRRQFARCRARRGASRAEPYCRPRIGWLSRRVRRHHPDSPTGRGAAEYRQRLAPFLLRRPDYRRDAAFRRISVGTGVVAGALLLTLVANGLIQLNIDPYWTQLFSGLMILAAGGIDRLRTLNIQRLERTERFASVMGRRDR